MTRANSRRARLVTAAVLLSFATATTAVAVSGDLFTQAGAAHAGTHRPLENSTATPTLEPDLGVPATDVVAFGASPSENADEAWAYGWVGDVPYNQTLHDQWVLLERGSDGIWQVVPLDDANGLPIATNSAAGPSTYGIFAGQATPDGGVVLLLSDTSIVVRNPGSDGQPQAAPSPGAALASGESLLPSNPSGQNGSPPANVPYAALDETDGQTGVLIAPQPAAPGAGTIAPAPGVLHFDGQNWSREPVEAPSTDTGYKPLALQCGPTPNDASIDSPDNCWLLASAQDASGNTQLLLFTREQSSSGDYSWVPEQAGSFLGSDSLPTGVSGVAALGAGAQMLTVTSEGVWVDFSATVGASSSSPIDVSELVTPGSTADAGSVFSTWCSPTSPTPDWCTNSLGQSFPTSYRSFAWAGTSTADPGTRVITGLPDQGLLELTGPGDFVQVAGGGGINGQQPGGAAFDSLTQGWLADGAEPTGAQGTPVADIPEADGGVDDGGSSPVVAITTSPAPDQLSPEAVPFDQPLLAVATEDGQAPGQASSPALAVGLNGEVAGYTPGEGWLPESLLNASGVLQTPTLTGVAWPESGRAYAVGRNCAMWLWQSSTDLWESDPAKPYNCTADFNAVAFQPGNPDNGWAVGKQGVMMSYGKTWTQADLVPALQGVDFTSVTFAGSEAIATYQYVEQTPSGQVQAGGIATNDGSGWEPDTGTDTDSGALLSTLPSPADSDLTRVAGLPNGDVVAAGPGVVIERNGCPNSCSWRFSPEPLPGDANVSALAAFNDPTTGDVRAVISVDLDADLSPDWPLTINGAVPDNASPEPTLELADPLDATGYVLEQTADGWQDMEHMAYPASDGGSGSIVDAPVRPDPVLALSVAADGSAGLAVGGETGDVTGSGTPADDQTAAVMRFNTAPGATPVADPNSGTAPITADGSQASFALGGDAACEAACAALANDQLGPDVDLQHSLSEAGSIQGLRGFLYAGGRLPTGNSLSAADLGLELDRFDTLLNSDGDSPPVYAAASADATDGGADASVFNSALGTFAPEPQSLPNSPLPPAGTEAYAFQSPGASGPVDVIVLDFSSGSLGTGPGSQLQWLETELSAAKQSSTPAIVMGADALDSPPPSGQGNPVASDASEVSEALVQGGASAYLFEFPGANLSTTVTYGGDSIPAFGSGTLGYYVPPEDDATSGLGNSAFLVVSVATADRNPTNNRAPVTAVAIPNIGSLALDAEGGTLLKRSEVTLFDALARRPLAGTAWTQGTGGTVNFLGPQPYDAIPFDCSGPACANEIPEQATFSSSNPDIGDFVQHDATSQDPLQVAVGQNGQPIADSSSGLFCAYNAGTTTVTVAAGGLSYSLPVTVQAGSVEQPCGTTPLKNAPPVTTTTAAPFTSFGGPPPPVSPSPTPTPAAVTPKTLHTPIHVPKAPAHHVSAPAPAPVVKPPVHHVVATHPKPTPTPAPTPVAQAPTNPPAGAPALVPLHLGVSSPAPTSGRPTPPSGTAEVQQPSQVPVQSPVSSPFGAVERARETEHAAQHVHHMVATRLSPVPGAPLALASDRSGTGGIPPWLLVLALPAALGGVGLLRRRPRAVPALISGERRERRR